jgi:hypothetical protein
VSVIACSVLIGVCLITLSWRLLQRMREITGWQVRKFEFTGLPKLGSLNCHFAAG